MTKLDQFKQAKCIRVWLDGTKGRKVHPLTPEKRHSLAGYRFERLCRGAGLFSRLPF